MHDLGVTARITEAFPLFGGIARRSESGHDGGWKLRLVGVANSGAADRSIGSDSARAAAPGSVAGLPRFSDHADVHRCERPALCGQRRSGWAAAHSCANQWPGCGARPRLGFAAHGRWTVAERTSGSDLFGAKCFGARRRARHANPPTCGRRTPESVLRACHVH